MIELQSYNYILSLINTPWKGVDTFILLAMG